MNDNAVAFEQHRHVLMALAYRMLGTASDAEDVVQEAWLRWSQVDVDEVNAVRGYLIRVTTRLAIDRLRRMQARREVYPGPWLPEPVETRDVADDVVTAESVSFALLVVMETLSPLERAVFVLREAFGLPHADIAEALGRNEDAVRQLARRARDHVRQGHPRFETDDATRHQVTERFLAAAADGDLEGLMQVLAPDVDMVADGGGRVLAPRRPLVGAAEVARFLLAIGEQRQTAKFVASATGTATAQVDVRITELNGETGVVLSAAGTPISVLFLGIEDGRVQVIHLVANPSKLDGVVYTRR